MRGLHPRGAIGGEPTCGDEEVRVGMILHRARPGVQHGEDAERAADPRAIGGERLDGGRRFAEEERVDHVLV